MEHVEREQICRLGQVEGGKGEEGRKMEVGEVGGKSGRVG